MMKGNSRWGARRSTEAKILMGASFSSGAGRGLAEKGIGQEQILVAVMNPVEDDGEQMQIQKTTGRSSEDGFFATLQSDSRRHQDWVLRNGKK